MTSPKRSPASTRWRQREVECEPTVPDTVPCTGWFPDVLVKDDLASMELPLFALKAGDTMPRIYEDSRQRVEIIPSILGAATQRDKDILLFCVSQLMAARNRGRPKMNRKVGSTVHAILQFCGRGTSGKDYDRLIRALLRLRSTTIRTDRAIGGKRVTDGFGLIENFRVEREEGGSSRMQFVEITISEWMFNSVLSAEVLSISPDYFALSSDLARRIYEIARKHCGKQPKWAIGMDLLLHKSGSRLSLREFRRSLKRIASSAGHGIPDFRMVIERKRDVVTFYSCRASGYIAELSDRLAKANSRRFSNLAVITPVDNL